MRQIHASCGTPQIRALSGSCKSNECVGYSKSKRCLRSRKSKHWCEIHKSWRYMGSPKSKGGSGLAKHSNPTSPVPPRDPIRLSVPHGSTPEPTIPAPSIPMARLAAPPSPELRPSLARASPEHACSPRTVRADGTSAQAGLPKSRGQTTACQCPADDSGRDGRDAASFRIGIEIEGVGVGVGAGMEAGVGVGATAWAPPERAG
jgi:hypothetical protein